MEKNASEESGYMLQKLQIMYMYMDQHKETLEAMMGCVQ
jgi:hypothetical protein